MKKILSTIILILLAGYIVFAAITFCDKPASQVCKGIHLEMQDSLETGYMTSADIVALLAKSNLNPTGVPLEEVNLRRIEEKLNASPLIAYSECYKTISGHVVVQVKCRRPILRVMTHGGDSYYLDEEGEVIEHIAKAVYVPVATGYITRKFAQEQLLSLALYLQENELWNAQIEQICVTPRGELELIPRVGDHVIVLGSPGNYAYKFGKLRTFYEKGLSEVGWNRYSRINVNYSDQVIGTLREE